MSGVNRVAQPTKQQIAGRAYALYVAGGFVHGKHEEHWREAERQLTEELKSPQKKKKN